MSGGLRLDGLFTLAGLALNCVIALLTTVIAALTAMLRRNGRAKRVAGASGLMALGAAGLVLLLGASESVFGGYPRGMDEIGVPVAVGLFIAGCWWLSRIR